MLFRNRSKQRLEFVTDISVIPFFPRDEAAVNIHFQVFKSVERIHNKLGWFELCAPRRAQSGMSSCPT